MRVKLILTYDVLPRREDEYYEFMTSELLVWMQEQGLILSDVWHTLYGEYPMRMVGLVAQDEDHLNNVLRRPDWKALEERIQTYVTNYRRRVVPYRGKLQF